MTAPSTPPPPPAYAATSPASVLTEFGHGAGRQAFEAVWTITRYAVLARLLAAAAIIWRFFIKHRILAALKGQVAPPDGGGINVVRADATLTESFADLPRAPE